MANALEILVAARELITPPEKWTQESYARDAAGGVENPGHETACKFCVLGALYRVSNIPLGSPHVSLLGYEQLSDVVLGSVVQFNDTHTHAEVLAMFDTAIEAERAKAGGA